MKVIQQRLPTCLGGDLAELCGAIVSALSGVVGLEPVPDDGRVRRTRRMIRLPSEAPRVATTAEAATVARLLDAFNREFDTTTPGPVVAAKRLEPLLAGDATIALLAGDPAVAVAVLTLRTNKWYEGRVGLLDELYVVPGAARTGAWFRATGGCGVRDPRAGW